MAALVDERTLAELLERVAAGEASVEQAVEDLRELPYESVSGANVDHHRELRTGQAEVVYGPGKTPDEAREIVEALLARTSGAVMVTRATQEQYEAVQPVAAATFGMRSGLIVAKAAPHREDATAGPVAVVTGGTSDVAVADEAAETLWALGVDVTVVRDVGVAGIHRLIERRADIEAARCAIVVAGMEGALPSAVAGLVSTPVIAVPTSIGYGAAFEGMAALLGMLTSCAPGIVVVNIDNGFGAAMAADRIVRKGAGS